MLRKPLAASDAARSVVLHGDNDRIAALLDETGAVAVVSGDAGDADQAPLADADLTARTIAHLKELLAEATEINPETGTSPNDPMKLVGDSSGLQPAPDVSHAKANRTCLLSGGGGKTNFDGQLGEVIEDLEIDFVERWILSSLTAES